MFLCISHVVKNTLCTFWGGGDILDSRNGNNLKLKVKSEYSLSMGLMLIGQENGKYTVLPYRVIIKKCNIS